MSLVSYQPPGPVAGAFHADNSFVRGLMGPVGSGKSSSCCVEIMTRALEQQPGPDGKRHSRWAILRSTYPELKSTTIKTWTDWFGPICQMKWDTPITSTVSIGDIGDGTGLELEVLFLAMDRPEDVGKMRSLELTGGWMNEAGIMEKAVLDTLTQRIGRYPAKRNGGPTWTGVIMDTNPPDDDSWWYKLFEETKPKSYKLYKQPGGLFYDADEDSETFGEYLPHPDAENVENLPAGYEYYNRQVAGKTEDWVRVFLCGLYGTTMDGKPVYPEWKESFHLAAEEIEPIHGVPIILAFDFGLTPACTFGQMSPKGQLLVLNELVSEDMGIRQFYSEVVLPEIRTRYSGFRLEACGDPAGTIRSQTNEKTCMQELMEMGLLCEPAPTNEFIARRESVAFFLQRAAGGEPGFVLDPKCRMLRKGFNGGYRYERIRASGATKFRDRPVKDKFSHCFVAGTMVSTPNGPIPIERLLPGDLVDTPFGPRLVTATMNRDDAEVMTLHFSDGSAVECTPDHPFITPSGRYAADTLKYGDVLIGQGADEESLWADQQSTRFKSSAESVTTGNQAAITRRIISAAASTCTALYGWLRTGVSRTASMSITRAATSPTTGLRTLSLSVEASTSAGTSESGLLSIQTASTRLLLLPERLPGLGMDQKRVASGTPRTGSDLGLGGRLKSGLARSVPSLSRFLSGLQNAVSALLPARRGLAFCPESMTKTGIASCAGQDSAATGTPRRKPAPSLVGKNRSGERKRVYDLTVDDAHCFYAEGILVSNCHDSLQYLCLQIRGEMNPVRAKPIVKTRPVWA